jgi:Resolvase, N terminal domain
MGRRSMLNKLRSPQQARRGIFAEKVSGAVTDRKALARAIAALGPRDVLLVTRLDRLARSTRDLLNVLDAVAPSETKGIPEMSPESAANRDRLFALMRRMVLLGTKLPKDENDLDPDDHAAVAEVKLIIAEMNQARAAIDQLLADERARRLAAGEPWHD